MRNKYMGGFEVRARKELSKAKIGYEVARQR